MARLLLPARLFELGPEESLKKRVIKKIVGADLHATGHSFFNRHMNHCRTSLFDHRGKGFGRAVKQGYVSFILSVDIDSCDKAITQKTRALRRVILEKC